MEGVAAAQRMRAFLFCYNRVGSMFTWFFQDGPVTDWDSAAVGYGSVREILPGDAGGGVLFAAFAI